MKHNIRNTVIFALCISFFAQTHAGDNQNNSWFTALKWAGAVVGLLGAYKVYKHINSSIKNPSIAKTQTNPDRSWRNDFKDGSYEYEDAQGNYTYRSANGGSYTQNSNGGVSIINLSVNNRIIDGRNDLRGPSKKSNSHMYCDSSSSIISGSNVSVVSGWRSSISLSGLHFSFPWPFRSQISIASNRCASEVSSDSDNEQTSDNEASEEERDFLGNSTKVHRNGTRETRDFLGGYTKVNSDGSTYRRDFLGNVSKTRPTKKRARKPKSRSSSSLSQQPSEDEACG